MANPNDWQVGGDYYGGPGVYQHWDLVVDVGMGYLEGNVTKYISRWRKKGGHIDLDKALHYIEKLQEVHTRLHRPARQWSQIDPLLDRFAAENGLDDQEKRIVRLLIDWSTSNLIAAHRMVRVLRYQSEQPTEHRSTLPDPEPVPANEENLHADRAPSSRPRAPGARDRSQS